MFLLRVVPTLSSDCFVCNMTCLDIANIVCLLLLFSRGGCGIPQEPHQRRTGLTGSSAQQNNAGM